MVGEYVPIDQRSRYPEVETVSSTSTKPTKEKLRHSRANGHLERFMRTLNKAAQIAHLQGRTGFERNKTIYDI